MLIHQHCFVNSKVDIIQGEAPFAGLQFDRILTFSQKNNVALVRILTFSSAAPVERATKSPETQSARGKRLHPLTSRSKTLKATR
jgi:hypothetical protein